MGSSASMNLTADRQAKLALMSDEDRGKLQKQMLEWIGLGKTEEQAVQMMLKEYEDAVDQDWAWGMEGKNVIRRDSIFDDEEAKDELPWKDAGGDEGDDGAKREAK